MARFNKAQMKQLLKEKQKKEGNKARMNVKDRDSRANRRTIDRRPDENLKEATETTIVIEQVIPGLNGKEGLIRESGIDGHKRKKKLAQLVGLLTRNKHIGPVIIMFTRYTVQEMDWDNMCASFKNVGDALVYNRVIEDDKPSIVKLFLPTQVVVPTYKEQKSVVKIISIDEKEGESTKDSWIRMVQQMDFPDGLS